MPIFSYVSIRVVSSVSVRCRSRGAVLPADPLLYKADATSFADLTTVDGICHPTFKLAAVALGVLEDDAVYYACLNEAALSATAPQMRDLFANVLTLAEVQDPLALWEQHKDSMIKATSSNKTGGILGNNQG